MSVTDRVRVDRGTMTATGTLINAGRHVALAGARLQDSDGRVPATANCLVGRP
ncbi:hypothetical protein [Actinocrispum sp. NPDC049592]|uniref:hypothetical protein n=1 Tax=Actinocrispum sp. NPDC049592 TaxID=3154835 RepID=UPI003414FAB0